MATFDKRGDLQWRAQIRRKGYPVQRKTFNSRAEAEAWAATVESEMARGIFVSRQEAETTTLSFALDRYEREVSSTKKGVAREQERIRVWKKHPLVRRPLAAIRGADVAAYRDQRLKVVGPNTVRLELALLSHLFTIARKEWGMEGLTNPVSVIRKPKPPQGRERRLKEGELERILAATESPVLPSIVRLAIETGMRRGEIASLTWDVIDLKRRTIALSDTKNGERRIVPLSKEAVRIFSELPRRLDGKLWGIETGWITKGFLDAVVRARKGYEKECGDKRTAPDKTFLVNLRFHDLRHEATSRFFEKGLNPMEVSAITGHKTLQMLRRYTHLKPENLARMLDGQGS